MKRSPKDTFQIHVFNWLEYNAKSKPALPSIMVSKRFFDDARVRALPASGKLLYLGLLMLRGDVPTTYHGPHSDLDATSVRATRDLLQTYAGGTGNLIETLLDQLQSLQLVSYEKIDSLLNRKEKKEAPKVASSTDPEILGSEPAENAASSLTKDAQQKLFEEKSVAEKKKIEQNQISKKQQDEKLKSISRVQDLIALLPDQTRQNWRDLYAGDKDFVNRQLIRCWQYYAIDQSHRRPQKISGWSRAINTWLEKEWISHSRTVGAKNVRQR